MPPNIETEADILKERVIPQEEFQKRVEQGEALFIYDAQVYNVSGFMKHHPGGEMAIRHVLGKDATDEIRVLHPPRVYERMIHHYSIGSYRPAVEKAQLQTQQTQQTQQPMKKTRADTASSLKTVWNGGLSVDSFDKEIQYLYTHHANDMATGEASQEALDLCALQEHFRRLEQDIKDRGWFECNYWRYAKECCRYILCLYLSLWLTLNGSETWHYMGGAVCMACFWHQLVFTAHDAGHNSITGRLQIDHLIGVGIANFIGGLSLGWWKDNHNVHHIVTNHPEHDPDIQHLPFLAITEKLFNNLYSTYYNRIMKYDAFSRFFVKYQHHLYYLILSFGRFNLHVLSIGYLLSSKNVRNRTLELSGIAFFFVWYSLLLSTLPTWNMVVAYVLVSYMLTFPLHVQITLSHFGMSTQDMGFHEPFPAKMLRTTMDVDCPEWLDWFHGGLQYQAVHHLFPRIPRHNLRLCVPFVKDFCHKTGLHYYSYNFSTGNGVVLGALKAVADQVGLMNEVARHNASVLGFNEKSNH
ncbi:delta-6-fatty acid desaturase [Spinellus fusiger]|nr:delta-6-fatty acid desaturase [Spinellus fusiger]